MVGSFPSPVRTSFPAFPPWSLVRSWVRSNSILASPPNQQPHQFSSIQWRNPTLANGKVNSCSTCVCLHIGNSSVSSGIHSVDSNTWSNMFTSAINVSSMEFLLDCADPALSATRYSSNILANSTKFLARLFYKEPAFEVGCEFGCRCEYATPQDFWNYGCRRSHATSIPAIQAPTQHVVASTPNCDGCATNPAPGILHPSLMCSTTLDIAIARNQAISVSRMFGYPFPRLLVVRNYDAFWHHPVVLPSIEVTCPLARDTFSNFGHSSLVTNLLPSWLPVASSSPMTYLTILCQATLSHSPNPHFLPPWASLPSLTKCTPLPCYARERKNHLEDGGLNRLCPIPWIQN